MGRILGLWGTLSAHRDADINPWLAAVVPIIRAGQQTEVVSSLELVDRVSRVTTGLPAPVVDLASIRGRADGVSLEDVYTRPFHRVWTDLSEGRPYSDAKAAVGDRLGRAIEADLQLASRNAVAAAIEADPRVVGYRRVLSARPHHCGLCEVASTNHYKREDLLPIHPGCGCSVEPVYESTPEASDFLDAEVSRAYQEAVDAGVLKVSEHPEYGPYLEAA